MGKAEAGGPETAGGAGAVVAGLVAAGVGLLAGELGFTVEGAGVGGVTLDGDGDWEGCEAVAVTVAVADVPAVGGATVALFFAEQAVASSATTASTAGHQRPGRRPRDRTGCTVPM
jgi:hypothetical protein